MKKILIAIEVNELPGEDLDLSDAVADVTLYPNIELADDYINRIGRWFYAKVMPLNDKALKISNKDFIIYQRDYLMANLDREINLWKSAKEFEEKQNEKV